MVHEVTKKVTVYCFARSEQHYDSGTCCCDRFHPPEDLLKEIGIATFGHVLKGDYEK
jgi:hypothetical protein